MGRQFFVVKKLDVLLNPSILQLKAYHVIFNYIMTSESITLINVTYEPKIWLEG